MSKLIAALLGLALGGCNMVVSEQPWFAAGDALQPGLKDGLWVNLKDDKCRFDPAEAIQDWPDCAQPMLVQGGFYRGPGPRQDDPGQLPGVDRWERLAHLLAAGEPAIDQIDLSSTEEADTAKPTKGYLYLATRITARDEQGRAVEVVRWPVACGPLSRRKAAARGGDYVTGKPFPGLVVKDSICMARDVSTLRRAAALSEKVAVPNGTPPLISRWVRDSAP